MEEGYEFGLILAAAGLPSLALVLALGAAWPRGAALADRVRAASLWAACGLALLSACAAVVSSAETMNLGWVVLAQRQTRLHVFIQPAAAAVYLVSLVLAAQEEPLRAILGPPSPRRHAVVSALVVAAGLLGAVLFLGGEAGPWLPGLLWLVLKAAAIVVAVIVVRRGFRPLAPGPRLAIAWAAVVVGLLNVGISVMRAGD